MSLVGNGIFVCKGELSTLMTAMRRGSRWNGYQTNDDEQDGLMKQLIELKQILNQIEDLRLIDPIIYLGPFLEIIRTEETTGAVTSLALASINKFLSYGMIDPTHPALAATVESIADAVTHARFMGTDQSSDGVTLMRVVEVLHTLIRSPEGSALTNESVCEVMLSCFKICFEPRLNELLRRKAEQALKDMVLLLFIRLPQFPEDVSAAALLKKCKMVTGPIEQNTSKRKGKVRLKKPYSQTSQLPNENENKSLLTNVIKNQDEMPTTPTTALISSQRPSSAAGGFMLKASKAPPLATTPATPAGNILDMQGTITQTPTTALDVVEEQCFGNEENASEYVDEKNLIINDNDQNPTEEIVKELSEEPTEIKREYINSVGVRFKQISMSDDIDPANTLMPYGLPCIQELFRFLILLCNPLDKQNTDTMMHMGLNLITVALEVGADNIGKYEGLLSLVKDDLCRNLFALLQSERLTIFAADLQVCFLLFESLRSHLKYQLEGYLQKITEIISSENPRIPYEMRELCLDNLLQLWRIPGFVAELYINYDCDLCCSDVFENITKLLSKNTLSATNTIYSTHILSLDTLITVVENIEKNCIAAKSGALANSNSHSRKSSGLEGIIIGEETNQIENISNFIKQSERHYNANIAAMNPDELKYIKSKKRILNQGSELFNQRPDKGVLFLQENGLLNPQLDPKEIAKFLRSTSSLDKKAIGEYISKRKNDENKILEHFVQSFDFKDMRIDQALRLYLESFRLPGEAPLIFLVMEHFAEHWSNQNNHPFANTDAAFRLAYAIIMLNMDQHNYNAKRLNVPMTAEDFCKNLRGLNGNEDFDQEMLLKVFNSIKNEEIVMPAEQTGLVRENYLWKMLLRRSSKYFHVHDASYDRDIFIILWGQALSALSFMFDKSSGNGYQRTLIGYAKCACISSYYNLHTDFDALILTLCKFTSLHCIQPDANEINVAVQFGSSAKAQDATKCVFNLIHEFGDCLREEGWKNILDLIINLFRLKLLPKTIMEVDDFCEVNGKVTLILNKPLPKPAESGLFSSLYSYLSSEGQREPTYEEQEIIKVAKKCIRECQIDQIIQESKFVQFESLQEFIKSLIKLIKPPNAHKTIGIPYPEDVVTFWMEFIIKIVIQNRDRILPLWDLIKNQIYLLLLGSSSCGYDYLLNRVTIALLKLAIYLMRNEELCPIILQSLKMFLIMKPQVISKISKQISIGIFELLKTSAQNIHTEQDWLIIFTLLEVVGAGLMLPENEDSEFPFLSTKSDGAISSEEESGVQPDRGYTSDSEIINNLSNSPTSSLNKTSTIGPDGQNTESWMLVNKESEEFSITSRPQSPLPLTNSLAYACKLIEHRDSFALFKCWDSLAFIVRNVAHITPYNFECCVRCIRTFVEACFDGGIKLRRKCYTTKIRLNKINNKKDVRKRKQNQDQSSDSENEDMYQRFETLSIQLLDLMYTLYTRTAQIFRWWAEEGSDTIPQCSTLWAQGWCPLLQGIARFAMDSRREVRTYAISCLQQRALLVHDLQSLSGAEWSSCFKQVLFPLLNELLPESVAITELDQNLLEESRIRTATIMSKVFLHHLTPLIELKNFNELWLEVLDYIEKFMKVGSDLLYEQMLEILKNMLLVMHSVRIFHFNNGNVGEHSMLWHLTWKRIDDFLPNLKEELFKQDDRSPRELQLQSTPSVGFLPNISSVDPTNISTSPRNNSILQPPIPETSNINGQPVIFGQNSDKMPNNIPILIPNSDLNSDLNIPYIQSMNTSIEKQHHFSSPQIQLGTHPISVRNYSLEDSATFNNIKTGDDSAIDSFSGKSNYIQPYTINLFDDEESQKSSVLDHEYNQQFLKSQTARYTEMPVQNEIKQTTSNPENHLIYAQSHIASVTNVANEGPSVPISHLESHNQYPSLTKVSANIVKSFSPVYMGQQPQKQGPTDIYTDYVEDPYNLTLKQQQLYNANSQTQINPDPNQSNIEKYSSENTNIFNSSTYFDKNVELSPGSEIFGQP